MKKIVVVLLLLVSVLSLTAGAFAQEFYVYENPDDSEETIKIPVDQAHVIGTIRFCVEEAQRLPAEIDTVRYGAALLSYASDKICPTRYVGEEIGRAHV